MTEKIVEALDNITQQMKIVNKLKIIELEIAVDDKRSNYRAVFNEIREQLHGWDDH